MDHFPQVLNHLWSVCAIGYLPGTHCIIPKSLMNHLNSFRRGMFKIISKFDADLLLYLLCHFECNGHPVHLLTQWCLPLPLTSTVKSSLFTHAHFQPLSLAGRLCITVVQTILIILTMAGTFSGHTLYVRTSICVYVNGTWLTISTLWTLGTIACLDSPWVFLSIPPSTAIVLL